MKRFTWAAGGFGLVMLALFILLCACPKALGAWGAGGCPTMGYAPVGPVGPYGPSVFAPSPMSAPALLGYRWEGWEDGDADLLKLTKGGKWVGVWCYSKGEYKPWEGAKYGEACPPPFPVPGVGFVKPKDVPAAPCSCGCTACQGGCGCAKGAKCADAACRCGPPPVTEPPIFGVDSEKITPDRTRLTVNGETKPVTTRQAIQAIKEGLPDDKDKPRLTAIGTAEDCAKVAADVAGDKDVVFQQFRPDDWQVKGSGFVTDGKPMIYLQAPDGKVLHRQDAYDKGRLDVALAAIRKPDPHYDPKKDPDLSKPADAPLGVPLWAWLAGGAAAVVVVVARRK